MSHVRIKMLKNCARRARAWPEWSGATSKRICDDAMPDDGYNRPATAGVARKAECTEQL